MAGDSDVRLGPVLCTGGNGFIAYHVIAKVLEAEPGCEVHSLDVDVSRNRHAGVQYHQCDISDATAVTAVVESVRPRTIYHLVSPETSDFIPKSAFHPIIAKGTDYLLAAARRTGTARALVNTSTSSVIHDNVSDLVDAREDLPILRPPVQWRAYTLAKADAEEAVAAANRTGATGGPDDRGLLTASLRPALVFGERDVGALGKMLAVAKQGRARFQMGAGQNAFDFVYAGNAADAHVLVAKALLKAWGKPAPPADRRVDGEVFNITNEDPWLFWDFQRAVAAAAGKPVRKEEIVVVPRAVGMLMAWVSEWVVWAASWGKRTPNVTTEGVRFSTMIRTMNGEKARRVLGYRPAVGMQEGIERGVKDLNSDHKTE